MSPRIICHMIKAGDENIMGTFMETAATTFLNHEYECTNNFYHPQVWFNGTVTTNENFTFYHKLNFDEDAPPIPKGDLVAVKAASMYYVRVDASGRIRWESDKLKYEGRPTAHIVEVLTGKVSNA